MDSEKLFKEIEEKVMLMFDEHCSEQLAYHNLDHTQYVVKKATQIAAHYNLSEEDFLVIFLAAWFHDTGYLFGPPQNHEARGAELMKEFGNERNLENELLEKAEGCIMATKASNSPANLLEEIIVDADTYNLGTNRFQKTNALVFKEVQAYKTDMSHQEFKDHAYHFLQNHKYYTKYTRDLLAKKKERNMKKLKLAAEDPKEISNDAKEKQKISEKDGTTKGMQTMLRLTSSNHIQLSEMADNKANILISVNAIIISVILSVLFRKLSEDPYLTVPTMIFLLTSVTTIVLAIMATRPKVNMGIFTEEDIKNKTTNLLFFGNFHKMPFAEYQSAMKVMMTDADYLYSSMLQDIHVLGTVLGKKYKLLRAAYTLFMIGLIVSVAAFALAVVLSGSAPLEPKTNGAGGSPF